MPYHTIPHYGCCYRRHNRMQPVFRSPYHTIPCHTIPYRGCATVDATGGQCVRAIPYHTIPYHAILYHAMPYHAISLEYGPASFTAAGPVAASSALRPYAYFCLKKKQRGCGVQVNKIVLVLLHCNVTVEGIVNKIVLTCSTAALQLPIAIHVWYRLRGAVALPCENERACSCAVTPTPTPTPTPKGHARAALPQYSGSCCKKDGE